MFHMTTFADDRIRDLHDTAAELRNARIAAPATQRLRGLRVAVGTLLLEAGTALVSGARLPRTSIAGR